jgi:hypothetical protein
VEKSNVVKAEAERNRTEKQRQGRKSNVMKRTEWKRKETAELE